MKSPAPSHPGLLRAATLLCAWFATAVAAFAQNTGTVQGRVFNPGSRIYVGNAEVRLEGTNQVAYTESDGTFQFNQVPAGPATVSVAFSGYTTAKDSFTVTDGQIAVREIDLVSTDTAAPTVKNGVVQLAAFTVDSEREGNAKAIMEQRRSMNISNSVSSDIFGDVTDGNVGEFLKYLPGVDIDYVESQARGPTLGGMESQYVGVSFDGIRTASADANRGGGDASRATSFEGFSINAVEAIDVNFTRSAEADADTPGGTINMRTRRAFDSRGRRIDYNVSASFNTEEFHLKRTWGNRESKESKVKPNYSLGYSEAFLNNRLGVLLSASRASNYDEQYQVANTYSRAAGDARPLATRVIAFKDGPLTILKESATLTVDYKVSRSLVFSLTGIYTYADSEFWNRTLTFTAANDNANVANGRPSIGGDALSTVVAPRAGTANAANVAMSNGPGDKLTYTRTFAPKFEFKQGNWLVDGALSNSRSVNNYDGHERGFAGGDALSLAAGWTATRPSPESWEWTIRQNSGADWFGLGNWAGGTRLTNIDRTWITDIWSGSLNARWTPSFLRRFPSVVRFGGKWGEESRNNRTNDAMAVWRYTGEGGDVVTRNAAGTPTATASGSWANLGFVARQPFDLGTTNGLTLFNAAGTEGQIPRVNAEQTLALFRSHPEQFQNIGSPANYATVLLSTRKVRQTVKAGYAQLQTQLARRLTVVGGFRFERTQNLFTEPTPRLREEMVAAGFPIDANGRANTFAGLDYQFRSQPAAKRRSEYDNLFPNVSVKFKILENFDFHTGYTKAIGRPPIDNLTGVWNIVENADGTLRRVDAPNAALLPEKIDRYDARLAYYFGGKSPGQATVTATQVNTTNLRETFDYTAAEFGVTDPEFEDYTFRSTRNSANIRRNYNLAVAYNQKLGFLPKPFNGTSVNFSYNRAYMSARRNGLAPHRLSSRLSYAYRQFNGNVGMVWIDDRPDGIYGRYRRELTQFDLSASWAFSSRYRLYVQARNFTGKPDLWMESPPGVIQGRDAAVRVMQEYGSRWVFGLAGRF